jgi:hypothetical protein
MSTVSVCPALADSLRSEPLAGLVEDLGYAAVF